MSLFDPTTLLKKLPSSPGVYQMLDENKNVLYVGKSKNLKKRVGSYFRKSGRELKTETMVKQICDIEVTLTQTENDALLLENNLIKTLKPRYNVIFKDDKTYPYLYVSHDLYPRLIYYRGTKQKTGQYFGPYPNAHDVQNTLKLLQKIFMIRNCNNLFFKTRTRPCMQYEIKRCRAPCVGLVSKEQYQEDTKNLILFLEGKTQDTIRAISKKMEAASNALDFEGAAYYRNQITQIRKIQTTQAIESNKPYSLDVMGASASNTKGSIVLLRIREGRLIGSHRFFHDSENSLSAPDLINAFLPQYYLNLDQSLLPKEVILPFQYQDALILKNALQEKFKRTITFHKPLSREKTKWLQMAKTNSEQALLEKTNKVLGYTEKILDLQQALGLSFLPKRLEGYDISHLQGESTTASCVVFTEEGENKSQYRQYHINNITPGDDYAALYQTFKRRFGATVQTPPSPCGRGLGGGVSGELPSKSLMPDLIFIDGGKGQLKQAEKVFSELGIENIFLVGVAKGEERKPGLETLYFKGQEQGLVLSATSKASHFVQQIRDEAHRFAITRSRKQTRKRRITSTLEHIPGIGPKKRKTLLQHFGGLEALRTATIEALCTVPGISKRLAEEIIKHL